MNGGDLEMKRELLASKRYAALLSYVMPLVAFASYRMIDRSDQWSSGLEWVCFILAGVVSSGSITRASMLWQDVRELKQQVEDATRAARQAAMLESITTRIQTGEIKPNPDFK